MSNSPESTPSRREVLVGEIFSLYADLGWAVPTSIEYSRLVTLEDTVSVAKNALESRNAPRGGRAIDRHETEIVLYLDLVSDGLDSGIAAYRVANAFSLTEERLLQLVRTWCAIAGIEVPA